MIDFDDLTTRDLDTPAPIDQLLDSEAQSTSTDTGGSFSISSPPRAKRQRTDSPVASLQRDVLLNQAMKAIQESDEWTGHLSVTASIIRKAVKDFPDMERQFRRQIMQFNTELDNMVEQRLAQQVHMIEVSVFDEMAPQSSEEPAT